MLVSPRKRKPHSAKVMFYRGYGPIQTPKTHEMHIFLMRFLGVFLKNRVCFQKKVLSVNGPLLTVNPKNKISKT